MDAFEAHIAKTNDFHAGLVALSETTATMKKAEVRVDTDQIKLNKTVQQRLTEIEQEIDLNV
jgi:hypothetical protein